jgi:hypothetical protein
MVYEAVNNALQREIKVNFRADYNISPGLAYKGTVSIHLRTA